jgi:hypothetical protein
VVEKCRLRQERPCYQGHPEDPGWQQKVREDLADLWDLVSQREAVTPHQHLTYQVYLGHLADLGYLLQALEHLAPHGVLGKPRVAQTVHLHPVRPVRLGRPVGLVHLADPVHLDRQAALG